MDIIPVSDRAVANLANRLKGKVEQQCGRTMVVQQRSEAPGKAEVQDEALILVGGGRTVIEHLIGRQIAPRGETEPVVLPGAGQRGRDFVARRKEATTGLRRRG